jgi:hypothetical protein
MHCRPSRARRFAAVYAVAFALSVLAAVAPRAARGEIIPLSQSHLLTANVLVGDTGVSDREEGSTIGPIHADARAGDLSNNAVSTLDLTFGGQTISGQLSGDANGIPRPTANEMHADGRFEHTFTVSAPTPYTLSGLVRIQGRYLGDAGSAELRLTEDGVRIGGNGVSAPGPGLPGIVATFDNQGTLLPGRTYALTGAMTAGMVVEASSNLTFSNSDVEFTLTVPEPTALCLLAPAALCLLARRRCPASLRRSPTQ